MYWGPIEIQSFRPDSEAVWATYGHTLLAVCTCKYTWNTLSDFQLVHCDAYLPRYAADVCGHTVSTDFTTELLATISWKNKNVQSGELLSEEKLTATANSQSFVCETSCKSDFKCNILRRFFPCMIVCRELSATLCLKINLSCQHLAAFLTGFTIYTKYMKDDSVLLVVNMSDFSVSHTFRSPDSLEKLCNFVRFRRNFINFVKLCPSQIHDEVFGPS